MRSTRTNLIITGCALLALCSMVTDALATDYFVRKTGSDANAGTTAGTPWLTVDHAVDSVAPGDTIYVGAGTYVEDVNPSVAGTVGNPIKYIADTDGAQTGDAGDVILSSPAGLRALYIFSRDYIEVYNFKISGGSSQVVYWRDSVGGVLDNCEVYNGGVYGVYLNTNAELATRDCNIHDNGSASGAGFIVNGSSTLEATDCTLSNNYRGGFAVIGTTNLLRCRIENSLTQGILCQGGTLTAKNCLITGGMSNEGVMANSDPANNVTLQNCTIADSSNHGVRCYGGVFTVTNCIIANHAGYGIIHSGGTMTHTYNVVYGNTSGEFLSTTQDATEIVADPQFVSNTDYRVRSLSPAVNAGTDLTGTVDDDIDGIPRPYDGAWDIGCYEMAPTGHWKLDDTAGVTAVDSSGRGYDGTYNNTPTLGAAGMRGNAVELDGVDQHVEVASIASLDAPAAITVACWAKSDTATWNSDGMLVSKRNQFILYPDTDAPNNLRFRWYVYEGGAAWRSTSYDLSNIEGFDIRDWHHYLGTYDPVAGIRNLYVDGKLVASTSSTFPIATDTGPLLIGKDDYWTDTRHFDGAIDDVRVYTYALNAAEIAALSADLIGHYKLDETSGTVAADSSGLGNDGTLVGSPVWSTDAVYGGGLEYDYIDGNDYVELPSTTALDDLQESSYTLATWFKPSSVPPETGNHNQSGYGLIKKHNSSIGIHYSHISGYQVNHYADEGAGPVQQAISASGYPPGKWQHVAMTVDQSAGLVSMYVNGELVGTNTFLAGGAGMDTGNSLWRLGISHPGAVNSERPAHGIQDDARIYNRALSATEIAELYGLMGHWKMDEGSGSTAADSTAFANDATLFGATWTTDCAGNSGLEFDGISDTAATNAAFDPPERGAIAMWFRSDGPPTSRQRPWGVGSDFEMWQDPDGFVSCDVSTDGFTGGFITTEPLHMDGRWYHLIAEYDSDDDSYAIYINGALHKSGISTWAMTKQAANTLTFGTRTGIAEYFEGGIRDFRIYNRPLTASEKSELSGLAAYWKLDETSGTVAVDSSSNGHDGTLVGSPTWTTAGNLDGALDFENSDGADRVDAGTFDISGNALSVSAWIRSEEGVHDGRIVFKSTGNATADQFWGFTIGESLEPDFQIRAGGTRSILAYSGAVSPGKWYYLVGTYDGTTMRLYINGVEVANMLHAVGGALDEDSTATVTLGDSPIGGRAYDGRIDDARIFNRTLCPTEIYGQYKTGRPAGIRILKWVEVR